MGQGVTVDGRLPLYRSAGGGYETLTNLALVRLYCEPCRMLRSFMRILEPIMPSLRPPFLRLIGFSALLRLMNRSFVVVCGSLPRSGKTFFLKELGCKCYNDDCKPLVTEAVVEWLPLPELCYTPVE